MTCLSVTDLHFSYGAAPVLRGVSFAAQPGQLLALLGSNGAGKSTLLRCVLGLLKPANGQAQVNGQNVRQMDAACLARQIAYVPQNQHPVFNFSVLDMVLMGTTVQTGRFSAPGKAQQELACAALERLGIVHLAHRGYMHISGGERQLALIARALAQQAKLLVLDEPTASLDYGNQYRVLEQVRRLADEGYTILQSTHSPDHALRFAHRSLALSGGKIIADGAPAQVLNGPLISTLYGIPAQVRYFDDGTAVCVPDRLECE